jgi:hypothetical protein
MQDTADDTSIIRSLLAPYVGRQVWFDPPPLIVVEPE